MGDKWLRVERSYASFLITLIFLTSALGITRVESALAQVQAFTNTPDAQITIHNLRQKAPPDECWAGLGPSSSPLPMWTDPTDCARYGTDPPAKPKVNQSYIWGMAETGDSIWFGTFANGNCVTQAGSTPTNATNPNGAPGAFVTDAWVCEYYDSPYYPTVYPDARIGDARTPRAYQYNKTTRTLVDKTPRFPNYVNPVTNPEGIFPGVFAIRGIRSATVYNNVVILAGPHLSPVQGLVFLAWNATTGEFLGGRQLLGYNNIRQFFNLNGVLYTGVGTNDASGTVTGGAVLRLNPAVIDGCTFVPPGNPCFVLNGTPQAPANPAKVGTLGSVAGSLTGHNGRIFTVTWPSVNIPGSMATLYMSPPVPAGGLTQANDTQWTEVWRAADYEPDSGIAQTYAGGAIASFDGYLWWGTLHIPMQPFQYLVKTYPPATEEELLQDLAGTFRSTVFFRGKDLETNPQIDLVYGNYQLPVYTPPSSPGQHGTWGLQVNSSGKKALWGPSGFGNLWNTYSWSATVWNNKLWVGTMDWAQTSQQGLQRILNEGGGEPPENLFANVSFGADYFYFTSSTKPAFPESTNGIDNPTTYGVRNQVPSMNGNLFIGMANAMNLLTDPADLTNFGGLGGWELIELSPSPNLNTPTGTNVPVNLPNGVSVTYCSVTSTGTTFSKIVPNPFQSNEDSHPLLTPYGLNGPRVASGVDSQPLTVAMLWSSAVWGQGCGSSNLANVSMPYSADVSEPRLVQLQWDGTQYVWVNITSSVDPAALKISGAITKDYLGILAVAPSFDGLPQSTTVTPNSGYPGQTLTVSLNGQFTNFVHGETTAAFGAGIVVNSVTVTSSTTATASITISPNATPGARNVTLTTGSEVVTAANGFTIIAPPSQPAPPPQPPSPSELMVFLTTPAAGATVSGTVIVSASANTVAAGVQFQLDGKNLGPEDTAAPFSIAWNTATALNGIHSLTAVARGGAGDQAVSAAVSVTVMNSIPTATFTIPPGGGVPLLMTDQSRPDLVVSHARVEQSSNTVAAVQETTASETMTGASSSPTGLAIVGLRTNAGLVTETAVPASPEIQSGRIYAEIGDAINTGIAFSNTSAQDSLISFYFTDQNGIDSRSATYTLRARHQIVAFLNEFPFNGPKNLQGTFTFQASAPVSAIALRGLTNERGEFLLTTLPVAGLGGGEKGTVLPHFSDGGGWTTQLILVNPTESAQSGTVQFFGPGSGTESGQLLEMTVNGVSGSTFSYSMAPHAMVRLVTAGSNPQVQVGSVRINPTYGLPGTDPLPAAFTIFSFRDNGITVSEASVPAQPAGTAFRMYLESSGSFGQIGSIQSGIAIANPSPEAVTVSLELTKLDGTSLGLPPATITLPPGGQISKFLNELFAGIPETFQGIGKLSAPSNVTVAGLRGRYNERRDFLITTTPPVNDAIAGPSAVIFPHIANGQGYSTQLILFGSAGGSARVFLFSQDGTLQPATSLSVQ